MPAILPSTGRASASAAPGVTRIDADAPPPPPPPMLPKPAPKKPPPREADAACGDNAPIRPPYNAPPRPPAPPAPLRRPKQEPLDGGGKCTCGVGFAADARARGEGRKNGSFVVAVVAAFTRRVGTGRAHDGTPRSRERIGEFHALFANSTPFGKFLRKTGNSSVKFGF